MTNRFCPRKRISNPRVNEDSPQRGRSPLPVKSTSWFCWSSTGVRMSIFIVTARVSGLFRKS